MAMELIGSRQLRSCLVSFVPACLSIPFVFVYFLHRFSFPTSLFFILLLFVIHYVILRHFYDGQVFLRAHLLTFLLTFGLLWSASSPSVGLFTVVLSVFHLSDFIAVALWCPRTLTIDSFLLNHSFHYHAALVIAYLEYFIEAYYLFPNGIYFHGLLIVIGLLIIIGGEYLRKLSMYTARENFSHLIQDKPDKEHRLVITGIYARFRHPSYVGWFWWACGTQILLANPVCFLIYLLSSWFFFSDRIAYEEATLIRRYGHAYRDYQKRVPVGIPFIKGWV